MTKGARGETRAAEYLASAGYSIVARNYRTRWGEVDIVAERGDDLAFVEVKTWDTLGRESLGQSIDARKQQRIRRTAESFLTGQPAMRDRHVRFDVVFVQGDSIEHLEGAF